MTDAPLAQPGQRVVAGPTKVGNELRWRLQLADGQPAVLVQLVPELARDESMRRRYAYEAERLAGLAAPALAPTLAIGPAPDPRDPNAESPWRLRADPPGETLAQWLARRAPAPVDEALALIASVADAVHGVHAAGAVLRDLEPRSIALGDDGAVWLTDIGLARVDILSTRTASSLMLESSPYAAPEHLRATVVDQRADVYTLAAILWHALVGEPPFAGGLFHTSAALPPLTEIAAVPAAVARLVASCLADSPDARPESARDIAEVLRGRAFVGRQSNDTAALSPATRARVKCQACGASLRPELRLCLSCGKQAVRLAHVASDTPRVERFSVILRTATDDVAFLTSLREFLASVGKGPPPTLNFLTGDPRMYAKEERQQRTSLPATLFADLSESTANELAGRLRELGMDVAVKPPVTHPSVRKKALIHGQLAIWAGFIAAASGIGLGMLGPFAGATLLTIIGVFAVIGGLSAVVQSVARTPREMPIAPLARLRAAPAALPASDPLVARVATLLADQTLAADVREQVSELALLVQRLVDHRAAHIGNASVAMLTEPVEPLIDLIEREVRAVATIDTNLAELDEGTIVRALAASEARGEPRARRAELLAGLDRLRALEDTRSGHMQRLLEASSLVRRTVELGLSHRDDDSEHALDQEVKLALAALDDDL